MKKILTTLTLLITLCSFAFGQEYDFYFPDPQSNGVYTSSMSIKAIIYVDDVLQEDQKSIEIGIYQDDMILGRSKIGYDTKFLNGLYIYFLDIKGEESVKDYTFKAYNHATKEELSSDYTVEFHEDGYGTLAEPVKIYFTTVVQGVAQIKETEEYFNSLAEAVEAAEAGQTITLLQSTEGKGIVIDKSLTIDFATFTYTFIEQGVGDTPTKSNGFQIKKDNNVTLKNGTLNVDEEWKEKFYILIQNYSNLTVENMELDGTNLDMWSATDQDSYVLSNNSGDVNIINSTITANDEGSKAFAFDACKYENYEAPVVTLDAASTIEGKVELSGGELYTTNENLAVVAKKKFNAVSDVVGATQGWGTISTPVANIKIPEDDSHDIYMYEEKTAMWRYYTGDNAEQQFEAFQLGEGYLYANTSDITIELEGVLNTKSLTRKLGYTEEIGALAGFNFVGNPFAHNINDANFSTTDGAALSKGFYVISAEGAIVARPENAVIAPMESVMLQTDKETELTINNVPSSKRNAEDNGRLEISVANANYSDVAYVSFNEGRGLNKIAHRNAEIPMVYVPVDGINYAVATMNQDVTEIPVSFKAATIGEYTIGTETQNCEYAMMTLVDRFTGVETNLLLEDYTFIAKSNDNEDRFFIRLDNGQQSTDNSHFAYINNGMMYIYNIEGQGVVNVYDVTGRPVAEYNVAESANISTSEFAAGVYIIRMSDENGVKVQKIVVE